MGLGLALIRRLLSDGQKVAVTSPALPALIRAIDPRFIADLLLLEPDLSDERSIAASIKAIYDSFGHIDVVLSNASFAAAGPADNAGYTAILSQVLPSLLTQGTGHMIKISSGSVFDETLEQDLLSQGIKITTVTLGAPDSTSCRSGSNTRYLSVDGRQIGDPVKAAKALIQIAEDSHPPLRLYLGSDAYNKLAAKVPQLTEELERRKHVTLSAQLAAV